MDNKLKYKLCKKIMRDTGKGIEDFKMIENGDKVMICLSGGKDSWTLLDILLKLKQKAPIKFDLIGVNIDPNFKGYENNKISEYCAKIGVECKIIKTDILGIIEEKKRPGSSFCSFCARLKRGAIYIAAKEMGITKIALGHHADDLIETVLLNMFFVGQLKSMAPKMITDDAKHVVIRPMIYVREDDIRAYAGGQFPIICCKCPVCTDEDMQRKKIKKMLKDFEKTIPNIKSSMLTSLANVVPSHLLNRDLYDFDKLPQRDSLIP